ncbi:sulfite exporter TauE/SafE family protein [Spongiivirga sp. MCCC 1A20706]|uniref:hypothetical protein n=1 Tax=Spongiivirga sp. MCCC 1A20706 TaxID=3160963 RepID=UPI00397761E9
MFPIFSGLIAALLHVVTGPDHLAAVTPIALDMNKKQWKVGFLWGLGNLGGMLMIGLLFLFFKEYIPVETISVYSEQLVGIVLLIVGGWALLKVFRKPKIKVSERNTDFGKLSTIGIGFLHGLAGIAHFILLLPVLGFESQTESIQYIIGFALGTVGAMTLFTVVLGIIKKINKTSANYNNSIRVIGGVFAIVVGIYWLFTTI